MMREKQQPFLGTNNSRKMWGVPLRRKWKKGKRRLSRCEASEAIESFLDYCNGTYDKFMEV